MAAIRLKLNPIFPPGKALSKTILRGPVQKLTLLEWLGATNGGVEVGLKPVKYEVGEQIFSWNKETPDLI